VYAPSGAGGVGPYAFTFEILANTDIAVFKDDVLLTLTTHYTVTINSNGTGSVTITAAGLALSPASPTQYAIVGNRTIARSTDFTTGGDFFANTINDELDQQTIFAQQNAEGLQRALTAPQTDPTTIDMTLPRASVRANKTLAFDANGDPTTGEVIGDNRGNWAAGVAYNKRDIVKDTSTGNVYYCNTSHTSSGSQPITTNADSAKWDLFVDNESSQDAQTAAEAAQAAAEAAQSAAETAETNAETAETNAETAASAASTSASNASTSATAAASSASAASSSATAASGSASTASTQASNASTSASNASTSASSASTSATNAAASASTATTQASNASTSATNAASSASAASTSASNAATSETNAAASASTASTQASNAATSATAASGSATSAASSAAAAASALDSFDDRYLGTKTSDPTLDNDGNALAAGALYFSTTENVMKVYDGASWITATSAGATSLLRFRYVATSGQTTFSGADAASATLTYTVNNIAVHRNGVTLDTSEYTASNGTSIVLTVAAGTGDIIDIIAFKSFTVADALSAVSGGTVNGAVTITGAGSIQGLTVGRGAGAVATNTAVGASALAANTSGAFNVAVGTETLPANTSGERNVAVGRRALYLNTTGGYNVAVGMNALEQNTTASYSTGVGYLALQNNTTGASNTAIGMNALNANTTASSNTAVGYGALYANTTGANNTAVGEGALDLNTTGESNTSIGAGSLQNTTTGIRNTALGQGAGYNVTTGNRNVLLGRDAIPSANTGSDQIVIGHTTVGIGDNYFTFGEGGGSNRVYNQFTANATWTRSSDQRLKKEIQTNTELGLDFINDIRTVSYKWKAPNELDPSMSDYNPDASEAGYTNKMYGFIAQEVKSALDKHNVTDFAGWHVTSEAQGSMQGVSYEMFVVPLINAVKELKADLDATKAELAALKGTA
jgi:hypothetical protein